MLVSAWFVFVPMFFITLGMLNTLIQQDNDVVVYLLFVLVTLITAISAGIIWGGLFGGLFI